MERQLNSLALEYEFIEAIDGRHFSESEKQDMTQRINYAFLPGEIGCALSHQKIYNMMVHKKIPSALILEDDITLNEDIKHIINKITLDTEKPEIILLSRVNKYFKKASKHLSDKYHIHRIQQATTAHSYILNQAAAKSLLDNLYPIWMVADKWDLFEDLSLAKIYSIVPHPVKLSAEANSSTINQNKNDNEVDKKKKEIWRKLMCKIPLTAKIKRRFRRVLVPIFHKIIDQGKGS